MVTNFELFKLGDVLWSLVSYQRVSALSALDGTNAIKDDKLLNNSPMTYTSGFL